MQKRMREQKDRMKSGRIAMLIVGGVEASAWPVCERGHMRSLRRSMRAIVSIAVMWAAFFAVRAGAQQASQAVERVAAVDAGTKAVLHGSLLQALRGAQDAGKLSANTTIENMTLHFSLSEAQKTDLAELLKDQQDRNSPQYRHWLTPKEYAARFGLADGDVNRVVAWLRGQHFVVSEATPLHVRFSGTVSQVQTAFNTEIHRYTLGESSFFANATELSLPAALVNVVSGVGNLNSLRPHTMHREKASVKYSPNYTDGSGDHFVVPADLRTIYDIAPLYSAGYTGAGQSVVIVGQSAIDTADIANFHDYFGGNANLVLTLVPNSGSSAVLTADDESESDLDIEYSGAIAQDAVINFVYSGNNANYSVFDAIEYAIDNDVAPVISSSYGACESALTTSNLSAFTTLFDQANAQGQTLIAAAGDEGATGCDFGVNSATEGLLVQFPADAPNFTGIGGTEFNEGAGSYWNSTNGADNGSAISYIPEMVWNDSAVTTAQGAGLAAGGGGVSQVFAKPSWQVAAGVPADGARDIPDISLDASNIHDPYFFCGPANSNGDNCSDGYVEEAGGTSFGAPIFAGILTLINQSVASGGQGNINPLLYPLSTSTGIFHDVTMGNNDSPCTAGSVDCPAGTTQIGYSAGPGYDVTTGLGTIDAFHLAQAFPDYGSGTSLAASSTGVSIAPSAPNAAQQITFTANVASSAGGAPSGTVQFSIDSVAVGGAVAVSGGVATYTSPVLTAGNHIASAIYSGDSATATSAGSLTFVVAPLPATTTVLAISPAAPTTASAITVTASVSSGTSGSISGTVQFSVDGAATCASVAVTNGAANCAVAALTAGRHQIAANYSGSGAFSASSGTLSFVVNTAASDTTTVNISPAAPTTSDAVSLSATVQSAAGVPTGTVQFAMDGAVSGSPVSLVDGAAMLNVGTLSAGSHAVTANYSGDAGNAASSGSATFTVSSAASAFTLSATDVTLTQGQSGSSTVTITSTSTYAGTVNLSLSSQGISGACYSVSTNPVVALKSTATATIRIAIGTACTASSNYKRIASSGVTVASAANRMRSISFAFAGMAGILLLGVRRRKKLWLMMVLFLLATAGAVTGCGGGSSPSTAKGTYTITVVGADSTDAGNTASTTFALNIQ